MSDSEFQSKYFEDPFFKIKVNVKLKKREKPSKRKIMDIDSGQDSDCDGPKLLTLAHLKKNEKSDLIELCEKYDRTIKNAK